jgi:hypothetical protein
MDPMKMLQAMEAKTAERLKAECQLPAFILAFLRVLEDKGVLTGGDITRIYSLSETGAGMFFTLFESSILAADLTEGDPEDEAKGKMLALKILESGRWLLKQPIDPRMRTQLEEALRESELAAEEAAKNEDG